MAHRTIRFFKDERVETAQVEQIYEVMNRTATSSGLQTYSVIRVTDQSIKDKIAEICKQAYVAHAPELCVLLVDQYRNTEIARAKGDEAQHYGDMNNFLPRCGRCLPRCSEHDQCYRIIRIRCSLFRQRIK